jgi:hypothetical protein
MHLQSDSQNYIQDMTVGQVHFKYGTITKKPVGGKYIHLAKDNRVEKQ